MRDAEGMGLLGRGLDDSVAGDELGNL